ncbi:MAG: nucleotidyltransferase family protein [Lagierella massiliensis]|nr:nucleotidyltransferase family protein [Lagierella massiliensis]
MKNIAIISEYNPFHNGHQFQINEIKKKFPNSNVISIMSGNFVQRGEPSILNKFERCKNAIESGVDLVLQIPTIYSLQSAENFALGSFKILDSLNIVDYLSFGTETTDFFKLYEVGKIQFENKIKINQLITKFMSNGHSYPKAFEIATREIVHYDLKNLFTSNNILALEYIKSKFKINSSIDFIPIIRRGSNYLDNEFKENIQPSATAIRNMVYNNKLYKIKDYVPEDTFDSLSLVNKNPDFFKILKYNFIILNKNHNKITGFEKGIDDLIKKNLKQTDNFDEFITKSKSKRYKEARLKRFILNDLLDIYKEFIDLSMRESPKFVQVLGFNHKGEKILREISNKSIVKLIVNKKDFNLEDELSKKMYSIEEKSTNLYNIITGLTKSEYEYMPYVKK